MLLPALPKLLEPWFPTTDRDRTRTCNPQIRSLMPSPLGHTAKLWWAMPVDRGFLPERKKWSLWPAYPAGGSPDGVVEPLASSGARLQLKVTCRQWSLGSDIGGGSAARRVSGVGGIMVSIAAFQAVDPGSIPGRRRNPFSCGAPTLSFSRASCWPCVGTRPALLLG